MKKIQIELTTACNLNCEYCFRNRDRASQIPLEIVEKLAGAAGEYVLYGFGEPLMHEEITKVLELLQGKITISTNGMIAKGFEKVAELADRVGISIDVDDVLRKGFVRDEALKRFRAIEDKGFAQVVVTEHNLSKIPDLFDLAASYGLDFIATNVVANTPNMYAKRTYFEGSRRNVELALEIDEKVILRAIHDWSRGHGRYADEYRRVLKSAYNAGYSINILSILSSRRVIDVARKAEKLFEFLHERAREFGVRIDAPEFFGDARARECPYRDAVFIRSDGLVSSCMSFAYKHYEFVNGHRKFLREFIVADLNASDIDAAVERLAGFNELRENMENFPWCADCPHVEGRWYSENNVDCYTNSPSCSECLYSAKIAKCLL